jgi:adenylate kinase family enzyme
VSAPNGEILVQEQKMSNMTTASDRTATLAALRAELAVADYIRIMFYSSSAKRNEVEVQIITDRARCGRTYADERYVKLFDRVNALKAQIAELTEFTTDQELYAQCEADNRLRERLAEAETLTEVRRILGHG